MLIYSCFLRGILLYFFVIFILFFWFGGLFFVKTVFKSGGGHKIQRLLPNTKARTEMHCFFFILMFSFVVYLYVTLTVPCRGDGWKVVDLFLYINLLEHSNPFF